MAKTKKNRKNTVDLIKKVSKKQTSQNPFEVHVNKSKFNILGQKSKNDVGLPGVSRSKAIQKRKVTLLQEYKIQDKSNKFLDRRIGENNKNMTKEDKIMARFTAEKMRAHNKKSSLFNLDDDIVLTHQGRTLEEIEQFEDPRSDDEDDQDGRNMKGTLDAEFVKEAHFGGGMLSVAAQDGELSRQDLISQLIAESKKRKYEKQQLKESTVKLTEQLDSDWKDLLPLLHPTRTTTTTESTVKATPSITPPAPPAAPPPKPPVDKNSFDFLVKELRFEATGKPSDKLKSEDEIIRQEKHKLEQLERERLKRMSLHEEDKRPRTGGRAYKSADDLDDGFALENVDEDDHQSETSDKEEEKSDENSEEETDAEEEEEEEEENNEKEDDDDKMEDENIENTVSSPKGVKRKLDESEEKNEESEEKNYESDEEDENEVDETDGEEDEDSFDDLVDNEDSNEDSEKEESDTEEQNVQIVEVDKKKKLDAKSSKKKLKDGSRDEESEAGESNKSQSTTKKSLRFSSDNQTQKDALRNEDVNKPVQKSILKNSKNENEDTEMKNIESKESKVLEEELKQSSDLPFTFEVPKEYEELCELLDGRTLGDVRIILERMIKVNHWSLGGDNKAKLNEVFAFLLQYLDDSVDTREPKKCWQVLNTLSPILFDLCLMDPDTSGGYLRGVILEKYHKFSRRDTRYPSVHSLVFLKLVSTLFPTSDARHYVTTPALIFLCHALGRGNAVSTRDVAVGVFLATLSVEYIDLSKRYLSELINFLQGFLLLFCHSLPLPLTKPFKSSSKQLLAFSPSDLLSISLPDKTHVSQSVKTNSSQSTNSKISSETDLSQLTISASDLLSSAKEISTVFKVKALRAVLNLVTGLLDKYSSYDAAYLIFDNIAAVCRQLRNELNAGSKTTAGETKETTQNETTNEENKNESPIKVGKKKQKANQKSEEESSKNTIQVSEKQMDVDSLRATSVILELVQAQINEVLEKFDSLKKDHPFPYVTKEKEKPKILRLFEPEIKPVLKFQTKGAQKEREKLLGKYKKEMKGAVREIRKDGRFLQQVRLRQQSRADQERQKKVKEILGFCSNQEGEIRGLKRKKK